LAPGGKISIQCFNVVQFFNTSVNYTSVEAKDACFPALVPNMHCSIVNNGRKKFYNIGPGPLAVKNIPSWLFKPSEILTGACTIKPFRTVI
jgi:hypothetical protein